LEFQLRSRAFRIVAFLRQHVRGFERAYLLSCAPLSFRGGPHIEGDRTLTVEDMFEGRKAPDALYRNIHERLHGGEASGYDVSLSCALPTGIEGLLVCGRGAAYQRRGHDPSGMRARPAMMVFGQAIGTAAAVAALDGVTPRQVNVRKVREALRKSGLAIGI
jgi:hypothetical protein